MARARAAASSLLGAVTSRIRCLPMRTAVTSAKPSACRACSTAWPWGSSSVARGITRTSTRNAFMRPRRRPQRARHHPRRRKRVVGRGPPPGARRGQPDERRLRTPRLRHVEAGEPDRRRHHVEVAEDPGRLARGRELELIQEERRGDAETHHVDEAVELRAEARPGVGEARHAAVEGVEDAGEEDVPARAVVLAASREHHRPDAEEQIEQREQARHHHDHAPDAARTERRPHSGYSPGTLAPAPTPSPRAPPTTGWSAAGRDPSTREPNRIIPIRSACVTRSPSRPSVTMRRAISPAIWRTSTLPRSPRIPTDDCSLSRLALSVAACRNVPGW